MAGVSDQVFAGGLLPRTWVRSGQQHHHTITLHHNCHTPASLTTPPPRASLVKLTLPPSTHLEAQVVGLVHQQLNLLAALEDAVVLLTVVKKL